MRKPNNVLLTMGAVLLISSSAAMAGPPMAYGQYNASSSGVITSTGTGGCPAAATSCGAAITGNGFFQRTIVIGGETYFQTIVLPTNTAVTAGDVSGVAFADENFVKQGGANGVADQQHVFDNTTGNGDFTGDATVNAGWATGTGSVIALDQSVVDATNGFNVNFSLTGDGTNATSLTVTQDVSLNASGTDKQKFDLRRLSEASPGATATSVFLPTSISWTAGQIIQAIWMGQAITTAGTDQQLSGFQSYANITTDTSVSYTDQTSPGPFDYDTAVFGTAPTF